MKQVAKSLTGVMGDARVQVAMDRGKDVIPIVEEMVGKWTPDLYSRKPCPAVTEDGEFQGTDLDLSTFMFALADRGAVIKLPTYKGMRQATKKEGQTLMSKENRFGKITGLVSNQEVFTFGVRIKDNNVITTDSVGDFRVFNLTDLDGKWYRGWERIQFLPTAAENKFIEETGILTGNSIVFKNFVHPARRLSIFGVNYFITKLLIDRLDEEAKFLNGAIKALLGAGITYPVSGEGAKKEWPKSEVVGDAKTISVKAMQVELDVPEFQGEYPEFSWTRDTLVEFTERRRKIVYEHKPKLSYAVRCCELAFFLNAGTYDLPSWISGTKWEHGFVRPERIKVSSDFIKKFGAGLNGEILKMMADREFSSVLAFEQAYSYYRNLCRYKTSMDFLKIKTSKSRTEWDRLILFQPSVGELGVSIRKRLYDKSERVSSSY